MESAEIREIVKKSHVSQKRVFVASIQRFLAAQRVA